MCPANRVEWVLRDLKAILVSSDPQESKEMVVLRAQLVNRGLLVLPDQQANGESQDSLVSKDQKGPMDPADLKVNAGKKVKPALTALLVPSDPREFKDLPDLKEKGDLSAMPANKDHQESLDVLETRDPRVLQAPRVPQDPPASSDNQDPPDKEARVVSAERRENLARLASLDRKVPEVPPECPAFRDPKVNAEKLANVVSRDTEASLDSKDSLALS